MENPASPDLRRCRRPPGLYWIAVIVLAAGPLFAEEGGNDTGEFPAFTGMALGGTGPHPAVGGSAGISLSRYTMALLEASVIPLGGATLLPRGPVKIRDSDLFDFNFALQARVPVRNCRIDQYVQGGNSGPVSRGSLLGQPPLQIWPGRGGGCAVLRRGEGGIRAEYRYTSSAINFNRILGGVFYQLPDDSFLPFRHGSGRHWRK